MAKKLVGIYPASNHNETFDIREIARFRKSKIMLYLLENPLASITQIRKAKISGKSISTNHKDIQKDIKDLVSYRCVVYLPFFKKYVANSPKQRRDRLEEILFFVCLNNFNLYLKNNNTDLQYFYEKIKPFSKLDRKDKHKFDVLKEVPFPNGIDKKKPLLDQILIKIISLVQLSKKIMDEQDRILSPNLHRSVVNSNYWNKTNFKSTPLIDTDFFYYLACFIILVRYKNDLTQSNLIKISKNLDQYYQEDDKFFKNLKSGNFLTVSQKLELAKIFKNEGYEATKNMLIDMQSQYPSKDNADRIVAIAKKDKANVSYNIGFKDNNETKEERHSEIERRKNANYKEIRKLMQKEKNQRNYKKLIKNHNLKNVDSPLDSIINKENGLEIKNLLDGLQKESRSGFVGKMKSNDISTLLEIINKN